MRTISPLVIYVPRIFIDESIQKQQMGAKMKVKISLKLFFNKVKRF
jgi:hypothetical protein